jgi:hypothetical protein
MMQLQQGFATGEMGSGVRGQFGLHDSNSKPLMSRFGSFASFRLQWINANGAGEILRRSLT